MGLARSSGADAVAHRTGARLGTSAQTYGPDGHSGYRRSKTNKLAFEPRHGHCLIMHRLTNIVAQARAHRLMCMGLLEDDGETVVLLGPAEPGFWAHVRDQPEMQDGAPDPLDRWSKRIIGAMADDLGAEAVFPSDGPPYPPFISWALASRRCWVSPVGLLVHETAGLFVSFRGAIRLNTLLDLPPTPDSPCTACPDQPCRTACPVGALSDGEYDVPACKTHVLSEDGTACKDTGCAARRACPVSHMYGRRPAQSAFHMRAFLGE